MVYIRNVLLLVQVLGVLVASSDVGPEGGSAELVASVPQDQVNAAEAEEEDVFEDDDDGPAVLEIYDYGEYDSCDKLTRLNNELATVFTTIARELGRTFKPNCTEINLAAQYMEEGFQYIRPKTHLILLEREKKPADGSVAAVVEVVREEFNPELNNKLKKVGLDKFNDEIPFGCAPGDAGVVCYYRKLGVEVVRIEDSEDGSGDISNGKSDGEATESGSVHGGQGSVSNLEEGTSGSQA